MALKIFPDFSDIDLNMKGEIDSFLARCLIDASEYTFTNIFAFKDAYDFKVSVFNISLLILRNKAPLSFFCPVGSLPDIGVLFDYLNGKDAKPVMERVTEKFIENHISGDERFVAVEERMHFDYIHEVKELVELRGRRFHDKKNKVNRFRNENNYEYEPLTSGLVEECIEFEHYWCEEKDCEKDHGLSGERCAIIIMLRNFDALKLKGGVIRVGGKIAALTIAEELLPDTLVIHVEKATSKISGLYQAINQEFLMHEGGGYTYVNREQDLGIEGMRRAKMGYNPVRFVKKYRVTEK